MARVKRVFVFSFLLSILPAPSLVGKAMAGWIGPLLAGTAVRDITPPLGAPLGGYLGPESQRWDPKGPKDPRRYSKLFKPSEGTHDPLTVKALVVDNGWTKLALVKVDGVFITDHVHKTVAERIVETGIDRDHLILFATHTHSGSGAFARDSIYWPAMDLFDPRIFKVLADGIVEAILEANQHLRNARLGIGVGRAEGITENRRGDVDKLDPTVGVIRIDSTEGTPIAILYNFAVHGNVLSSANLLFSADVSGYSERYLEGQISSGVMALFSNGAEGDINPLWRRSRTFERAEELGEALGASALSIYQGITPDPMVNLDVATEIIDLPPAYLRPGLLDPDVPLYRIDPLGPLAPQRTRMQAIRVNDTVWAAIPGEPITDIGTMVKEGARRLGFTEAFIIALANDYTMYITTEEEYWQGGYEAFLTLYGPREGDLMVNASLRLIKQVLTPASSFSLGLP